MDDRDFQINTIKKLYKIMYTRIHFHANSKYPSKKANGSLTTFYIGFDDMLDYKYVIRQCMSDELGGYDDKNDPVIATYQSAEEIVDDGWRLD